MSSSFRTLHRRRNNINDKRHGNQLQLTPIVDQIETDYNNNGNNDVSDGKSPINGLKRSYNNIVICLSINCFILYFLNSTIVYI